MDPNLVSEVDPLNVDSPFVSEKPTRNKVLLIIFILALLFLVAAVFSWQIVTRPAMNLSSNPGIAGPTPSKSTLIPTTTTPLLVPTLYPLPTPDLNLTSHWRNYNAANYSLKYPSSLLPPQDIGGCAHLSDLPNPQSSPSAVFKDHTWIAICWETSDMPATIPPDPLSADLTMAQSFTLNSYSGLMGYRNPRFNTSLGPLQTVYLSHPFGGHIEFQLNGGSQSDFGQIISSIKFLDSNHGHIKIQNGNVYYLSLSGQSILANKNDFTQIDYAPLIQFTKAQLSPDQSKVFLFAQGGTTSEQLFYTKVNPASVKYIHPVSQALWSPNSRYIVYTSHIADAGGDYFLGVYDTNTDRNLVLSPKSSYSNTNMYAIKSWKKDNTGILVHYQTQSDIPYGEIIKEGDVVIPLTQFIPE